jgi:hypothetical protein
MFAAVVLGGMGIGLANLALASSVHADPGWETASANLASGVGSDTIQDLGDAWTGASPYPGGNSNGTVFQVSKGYSPLVAQTVSGAAINTLNTVGGVIASFDAITSTGTVNGPSCITSKPGGQPFDRPNGSGNGRAALVDAINGTNWFSTSPQVSCEPGGGVSVSGQIDFARSSGGPGSAGTLLTFIPLGRDGMAYAYWAPPGNSADIPVLANLTEPELNSAYASGTPGSFTINGHPVQTCALNPGSGTWKFFLGAIGNVANATAAASSATCSANNTPTGVLEENGGNNFDTVAKAMNTAVPGTDAIIPFSSASFIAQANGNGLDRSNALRSDNATNFVNLGTGPIGRSVTDGSLTATSATVMSTTANFNSDDVGAAIVDTTTPGNLPADARIGSVIDAQHVSIVCQITAPASCVAPNTVAAQALTISDAPYLPYPVPTGPNGHVAIVGPLNSNTTYFSNGTFGRNVYIVVSSARIGHKTVGASLLLKGLFSDAGFSISDGNPLSTTNLTSASANFYTTGEDLGRTVTGPGAVAGTTITAVGSTSSITISPALATNARSSGADGNLTTGSTTVTSASANFQPQDTGMVIADTTTPANIPANTIITKVVNTTTVQISAAAAGTATTDVLSLSVPAAGSQVFSFGFKAGAMCSATNQATRSAFGFGPLGGPGLLACGDTSTTGGS